MVTETWECANVISFGGRPVLVGALEGLAGKGPFEADLFPFPIPDTNAGKRLESLTLLFVYCLNQVAPSVAAFTLWKTRGIQISESLLV